MLKGTLHPLSLRIKLCIVKNPVILLNGHATLSRLLTLPSGNDAKIVILRHCQKEIQEGGFLLRLQALVPPFQTRP